MEYEFGTIFDLGINHAASVSKDRTSLFDGQNFIITPEVGKKLKEWLESGSDAPLPQNTKVDFETRKKQVYLLWLKALNNNPELTKATIQSITGDRPSDEWTEQDLINIQAALKEYTGVAAD